MREVPVDQADRTRAVPDYVPGPGSPWQTTSARGGAGSPTAPVGGANRGKPSWISRSKRAAERKPSSSTWCRRHRPRSPPGRGNGCDLCLDPDRLGDWRSALPPEVRRGSSDREGPGADRPEHQVVDERGTVMVDERPATRSWSPPPGPARRCRRSCGRSTGCSDRPAAEKSAAAPGPLHLAAQGARRRRRAQPARPADRHPAHRRRLGAPVPDVTVGVRSGDTPPPTGAG